jgi:hypothetical protein
LSSLVKALEQKFLGFKMSTKIIAGLIAGTAALVISAPQAHANAELEILVNHVVVASTGSVAGSLEADGVLGNLSETYSHGGITVVASADWTGNSMDLDNIDVSGAGSVQIILSDNNNVPPGGLTKLEVSGHDLTGKLNGNVKAYWSSTDNLLAQTSLVTSLSSLTGNPVATGVIKATAPFSLTEVVSILSGTGKLSTDDSVKVPDGGLTVALLGGAMMSLALVRSKLK